MLNTFALIPLFVSFICLFVFAYVHGQRRHTDMNRSFILFAGLVFVVTFLEFFIHLPLSIVYKRVFLRIATFLLMPFGAVFLNFIYSAIHKKREILFYSFLLLSVVSTVMNFIINSYSWMPLSDDGQLVVIPQILFVLVFIAGCFIQGVYGLSLLWKHAKETKIPFEKKQLNILLFGVIAGVMIGILTLYILPFLFDIIIARSFSSLSILAIIISIYLAIVKYNFLSVNIEQIEVVSKRLFENISEAVFIIDADYTIIQMNQQAQKIFKNTPTGYTAEKIKDVLPFYDPEAIYEGTLITYRHNGREKTFIITQSPIKSGNTSLGKIVIIRDISERVSFEEDLRKTQKIESLGFLAAGIAHDFNNYLTGIATSFSLLRTVLPDHEESYAIASEGEKAAMKASALTAQLLTFSKGDILRKERFNLLHLLHETVSFSLRGSNSTCSYGLPDNLFPVIGDRNQIGQAIQNIIINANQAMPDGGTIHIEAQNMKITQHTSLPLKAGKYVEIKITDEGIGISSEVCDKIFDPFFSTKESGKGIGLTTSYSIIKKHDGHITVTSQKGKGASFIIYLPITSVRVTHSDETVKKHIQKLSGHILVMDDEPIVLTMLKRIIPYLGFTFDSASNGEEALEVYGRQSHDTSFPYCAAILDLTVSGGMGGLELSKRLREKDLKIKMIVSSGYSNDPVIARYEEYGFAASIKKPFTIDTLEEVLCKVLG